MKNGNLTALNRLYLLIKNAFYKYDIIICYLFFLITASYVQSSVFKQFMFGDDFIHIFQINNLSFFEFIITPHGEHFYFFRNFVFYIWYNIFHLNAMSYYLVIIFVHSINCILLYVIIRSLVSQRSIALFGTLLWSICPVNIGSLGWISAFGHVGAATFLLLLLFEISNFMQNKKEITYITMVRWYFYLLGMATSFGTGLLIAVIFPLISLLLLYNNKKKWFAFKSLSPLIAFIPVLYFSINIIYSKILGNAGSNINIHLVVDNLKSSIVMMLYLINYGIASLLLGPLLSVSTIGTTTGPLKDYNNYNLMCIAGLINIFFTIGLLYSIFKNKIHLRYYSIAMVVMLICGYGIIALGRAVYYEFFKISLLDCIAVPRYHYLCQLIIAILICISIHTFNHVRIKKLALLSLIILMTFSLYYYRKTATHINKIPFQISIHSKNVIFSSKQIIHDQLLLKKSQPEIFIENKPIEIAIAFDKDKIHFPGLAAVYMTFYQNNFFNGKPVYFIETNENRLTLLRKRPELRIAKLLKGVNEIAKPAP